MTSYDATRPPSGDLSSPDSWLGHFLTAHPDGNPERFDSWADGQPALRESPELRVQIREQLETWRGAANLLAVGLDFGRDSIFRRRERLEQSREEPPAGAESLRPGFTIGAFTLKRFLAEGGMGQVWEAEDSSLKRRVALKLVRPDRVDERSLAFFAREARAGGRLSHPNIVTTLGYGTDEGLTWIAQELVEGSWTVKHSLDLLRSEDTVPRDYYREVAKLVARVADGMQAAHDAGVIHRDLKPQNILIGDDDAPKVTDFGLARVTDDSFLSQSGDVVGTWAYMSPEQVKARRSGLDHRTDVFSLGVVLYELLTLRRPFEGDTTHQIATQILEVDPPEASAVRSQCPQELAVICGKALDKKADARYASMTAMADDLRAHLEHRPITARPPSAMQRTAKWIRRNPTVSATGAVGAIALVAISGLLLENIDGRNALQASNEELKSTGLELAARTVDLESEKQAVVLEQARLSRVVEFQSNIYEELEPASLGTRIRLAVLDQFARETERRGVATTDAQEELERLDTLMSRVDFTDIAASAVAADLLEPARARVAVEFPSDPATAAELQASLGMAYQRLGLYQAAYNLLEECLENRDLVEEVPLAATLRLEARVASLLVAIGRQDEAIQRMLEVITRTDQHHSLDLSLRAELLMTLSALYNEIGDTPSAQETIEEANALCESSDEARVWAGTRVAAQRAVLLIQTNDFDAAIDLFEGALAELDLSVDDDLEKALPILKDLGTAHQEARNFDEAIDCFERCLEAHRQLRGADHRLTVTAANDLGLVHKRRDNLDRAEELYLDSLERSRRTLGRKDAVTAAIETNLGALYLTLGSRANDPAWFEKALALQLEALTTKRALREPGSRSLVIALLHVGRALRALNRFEEAIPYHEEAMLTALEHRGESDSLALTCMSSMGLLRLSLGELDESESLLRKTLDLSRLHLGPHTYDAAISAHDLSKVLIATERHAEALEILERALKDAKNATQPGSGLREQIDAKIATCEGKLQDSPK